jgi:hypothetical protein
VNNTTFSSTMRHALPKFWGSIFRGKDEPFLQIKFDQKTSYYDVGYGTNMVWWDLYDKPACINLLLATHQA